MLMVILVVGSTHMEFNPTDGAPRSSFELLPAGEYDIEVLEAEERESQKGNQMIALTLQAKHPDGYDARVWDYLVSVPAAIFKIKMFCEATGLGKKFEGGKLTAEDCVGKRARAKIVVDEGRDGFGDRNSVSDYVEAGADTGGGISTMPSEPAAVPPPVTESDIPF